MRLKATFIQKNIFTCMQKPFARQFKNSYPTENLTIRRLYLQQVTSFKLK